MSDTETTSPGSLHPAGWPCNDKLLAVHACALLRNASELLLTLAINPSDVEIRERIAGLRYVMDRLEANQPNAKLRHGGENQ